MREVYATANAELIEFERHSRNDYLDRIIYAVSYLEAMRGWLCRAAAERRDFGREDATDLLTMFSLYVRDVVGSR